MSSTVLPVRLKYAISQFSDTMTGVNLKNTYAKVKVKKIDLPKNVLFLYKKNEGSWAAEPLILEANYGDYDIYITKDIPVTEEFAIQYTVDNISYWDNNNGNNYQLLVNRVNNTMGGNVILNKAIAKTDPQDGEEVENKKTWLEGEIYVRRKVSYSKRVGIKISSDNGNTWKEVDANYEYPVTEGSYIDVALGELEVELWTFKTPVYNYNSVAEFFKLAVYYQNLETGEFYWDNNFDRDYKISKIYGSTIE